MPSRWFVPIDGIGPGDARLEHIHAAVSRWFDDSTAEHNANDKPYSVSPLTEGHQRRLGVEIGTLTGWAEERLSTATRKGRTIRLGPTRHPLLGAVLLHQTSWDRLAQPTGGRRWRLTFATPTTFRSGDRSSPLPHVPTILTGLARAWDVWSGQPKWQRDPKTIAAAWVSDLDLTNDIVTLWRRNPRNNQRTSVLLSGALGTIEIRCDSPEAARVVEPLLRLAEYSGVGSQTGKGLGVTRVEILGVTNNSGEHPALATRPSIELSNESAG